MADQRLFILLGTTKGVFVMRGDAGRRVWRMSGPHCDGWPINHVIGDPRSGTIWAGGGGEWNGAGVWRSTDLGETWTVVRLTKGSMDDWAANDPDFAAMIGWTETPLPFEAAFSQVWSLCASGDTLYAGTKPANLLASHDGGVTWSRLESLTDHPSAESWSPGAAGLVLHTIVPDSSDPQTSLGRDFRRRRLCDRRRRCDLGAAQPFVECGKLRASRPPCRPARR